MAEGYVLSAEDVAILREVVAIVKSDPTRLKNRSNSTYGAREVEDHQAPETYIAVPQDENGIPALTESGDGDIPGIGVCDIYRVGTDAFNEPILQEIGRSVKVHNVTLSELEKKPMGVTRDKFGKWLAMSGGGGGGGGTIQFTILSADCEAGCVEAEVTALGVGESSVEVGDTISVLDGLGCFFNVREDLLIGLNGIAHRFEGDNPCSDYDIETSHWRVAALCCSIGC